jgi:hypothetical protein
MNEPKKLKYEFSQPIVEYIINALNRVQISGVGAAQDLVAVVKMLQEPTNSSELEKEQYEALKSKFEKDKK